MTDDFEAVMIRARMKARGVQPPAPEPTPAAADSAPRTGLQGVTRRVLAGMEDRVPAEKLQEVSALETAAAAWEHHARARRDGGCATCTKAAPACEDGQALWGAFVEAQEAVRARLHASLPSPAAYVVARPAWEIRVEQYIPERHRRDVLQVCPNPAPAPGLPAGRCDCIPWRHYVPQNESQRVAFMAASEWAERAGQREGNTLALVGDVGTGKSHLMYAAIRRANERGVNAGAWGWLDLSLLLRDAKFARDEESHTNALYERQKLFGVRALAIDEIRPTSGTEFDGTELSQLMTRAYRECQDAIVTSNYADKALAAVIGLAATSRLTQVQLAGPDYRRPGRPSLTIAKG